MKSWIFFLAILFLSSYQVTSCSTQKPPTLEEQHATLADILLGSHVDIISLAIDAETEIVVGESTGSGVLAGVVNKRAIIITAEHMTSEDSPDLFSEVFVKFHGYPDLVPADIEDTPQGVDVAIISCLLPDSIIPRPITFSSRLPIISEPVYTIGSPEITTGLISHGIVGGQCGTTRECEACPTGPCYLMDQPVYPGNSGGAVVTEPGELVGVIIGAYSLILEHGIGDSYLSVFASTESFRMAYLSVLEKYN